MKQELLHQTFSRREALKKIGKAGALGLLIGTAGGGLLTVISASPKQTDSLPFQKDNYPDDFFDDRLFPKEAERGWTIDWGLQQETHQPNFQLSEKSVVELLRYLESRPLVSKEVHAEAVLQNVGILIVRKGWDDFTAVTCIKLDKSGLFLTVGHIFDRNPKLGVVIDPSLNRMLTPGGTILIERAYDNAFFLAATGKTPEPVDHLKISTAPLRTGQKLWQYAMDLGSLEPANNESKVRARYTILSGYVDNPPNALESLLPVHPLGILWPPWTSPELGRVRVKGMTPFVGASGAPIINDKGEVVGLESDVYMPGGSKNLRANYTGSIITAFSLGILSPKS